MNAEQTKFLSTWRSAVKKYEKALHAIAGGDDDIKPARKAMDKLEKLLTEAAKISERSYLDAFVTQLADTMKDLPKIAAAEETGREARQQSRRAEIKKLDEEIATANEPYRWMRRR